MARRRRRAESGAGTCYERADRPGTWVAEITVEGKRERRHYASRAAARAGLDDLRRAGGVTTRTQRETLGSWLRRWSSEIARTRVEPKTAQTYATIVRNQWLTQPIADRPLIAVQTDEIEATLEALLRSGLKRSTVEHARAVLSAAYAGAIRAKFVSANPVLASELPGRPDAPRVRQLRLSEDVAQRISDAVADHPLRAFVEIMLHMGFRPAEVLALRWEDVNPIKDGVIHVGQAVKQVGGTWNVGAPKTAHSTRDVPTPPELRPVLFQHFHRAGNPMAGWLFPSPDRPGQPDNPVRVAKVLRPLFDAAGVSLTPRDLRSLHATLLLSKGTDIRLVSKRLGHGDPATTWRRYAGVLTEEDRAAADRLSIWKRARRPKGEKDAGGAGSPVGQSSA